MKDFSQIDKVSSKDHLISEMVQKTGLPKEIVNNLYENFSLNCDGSLKAINESFENFIKVDSFDFDSFKDSLKMLAEKIANQALSSDERSLVTEELLRLIESKIGGSIDKVTLLEIVCSILLLKDKNKFVNIQKQIQFGNKMNTLFEEYRIDFSPINVTSSNNQAVNLQNAKDTVKLYGGLKTLLARNEKQWGFNYHLDNAYQAIMNYLNAEIIELTNMDNMVSISNNYHIDIITEFLKGRDINPLYRSVDNIKKLVPDIQTLVFDMMLLIHDYVYNNRDSMMFIGREYVIDYENAAKNLYSAISTSLNNSQVAIVSDPKKKEAIKNEIGNFKIFNNFELDYEKIDAWKYPVTMNIAVNMLHLIKACTGEFNLKIRGILNVYITKTLELLIHSEKAIIRKNSKYL